MGLPGEVHWHEGLFLQPHHLQTMQRYFVERFGMERRLAWSYPYGVVESELSSDALENMLIKFDRLTVVMPSGMVVSVPGQAHLPALDVKEVFETASSALTICIGVPLWYSERANVVDREGEGDYRMKRMYQVSEIERPDENTGENPQPMLVRQINARLLVDGDETSDLEVLPLLKIGHATGEEVGLPRQDPRFIPPCLTLGGSTLLRDLVRDLVHQVEASRKDLLMQMNRGGFRLENMRGIQLGQMLRLRTLNRFGARLPHLVRAPAVSPFALYVELCDLHAELASLHPERGEFDPAKYDHDSPALAFYDLSTKIRSYLKYTDAPRFMQIPFKREGDALVVSLTDEHLTQPNEYYLGIRSREDPKSLAKLIEDADRFKVMARTLVNRAIRGVELSLERIPSIELPSDTGLIYFRLLRGESTRMWERITDEQAIAIRWPNMESSDLAISLYMTVPQFEEAG